MIDERGDPRDRVANQQPIRHRSVTGPEQHACTIATLYWRLKRDPDEGTAAAAIKVHAQACGLIAYLLDLHPDEVARAVKEDDPVHG